MMKPHPAQTGSWLTDSGNLISHLNTPVLRSQVANPARPPGGRGQLGNGWKSLTRTEIPAQLRTQAHANARQHWKTQHVFKEEEEWERKTKNRRTVLTVTVLITVVVDCRSMDGWEYTHTHTQINIETYTQAYMENKDQATGNCLINELVPVLVCSQITVKFRRTT